MADTHQLGSAALRITAHKLRRDWSGRGRPRQVGHLGHRGSGWALGPRRRGALAGPAVEPGLDGSDLVADVAADRGERWSPTTAAPGFKGLPHECGGECEREFGPIA